jgi:hypothetical protein
VKEEAPGLEVEVGVDQVRLRFCDWWWAGEMLTNRSCPTTSTRSSMKQQEVQSGCQNIVKVLGSN